MKFLKRIMLALSTGYILYFYSERIFWSFVHSGDTLNEYLVAPLVYAFLAYAFLLVIEEFCVRSAYAIYIAGAAFGWIVEGIVASTLFGVEGISFPFTVVWTGLAWHALISVLIGWYCLRRILEKNNYLYTVYFSLLAGVFWGAWSTSWALKTPPVSVSFSGYVTHGLVATSALIVSQWFFTKSDPAAFRSTKAERVFFIAVLLLFYGLVTVPAHPISLVVLPTLFLMLYFILRKNKKVEERCSILAEFGKPILWSNVSLLFIMPLVATAVYSMASFFNLIYPVNFFVMMVTMILGLALFCTSAWRIAVGRDES